MLAIKWTLQKCHYLNLTPSHKTHLNGIQKYFKPFTYILLSTIRNIVLKIIDDCNKILQL